MGAKKRVKKLLDQGVIQLTAFVNVEKLEMHLAMILHEVESAGDLRRTIDRYKDCPRVINFFTAIGGDSLIALVMAENQSILECESMEKCSLRSRERIRILSNRQSPLPISTLRQLLQRDEEDISPCGVDVEIVHASSPGMCWMPECKLL